MIRDDRQKNTWKAPKTVPALRPRSARPVVAVGCLDVPRALAHAAIAGGGAFTPLAPGGKVAFALGQGPTVWRVRPEANSEGIECYEDL